MCLGRPRFTSISLCLGRRRIRLDPKEGSKIYAATRVPFRRS